MMLIEHGLVNDLNGISIQQYKTDVGFRTLVEGVNENLYTQISEKISLG